MPRGVKESGKKPVNTKKPATEKKKRKPYPSYQERIEAADKKIEQLQQLNASREALIAQTEAKLAERKEVLAKSQAMLEKLMQTRVRNLLAQPAAGTTEAKPAPAPAPAPQADAPAAAPQGE